ncbi:hypothetical protein RUM43_003785 [Polyplax serrata]|uniref:Uncharacterized protein n=1 Tax=Polyplax serrata TaxID=468196 RepID=A0AAN8S6M4_POLSC
MPALAKESITQKWIHEKVEDGKSFLNWKHFEQFRQENENGCEKKMWAPGLFSLSTSPTPRIHRIPSVFHWSQTCRSSSVCPPPENRNVPILFFIFVLNLFQNVLSALLSILWNNILIAPRFLMTPWFWLLRKLAFAPVALLRWILGLTQTRPANGTRQRVVLISGGSTVQTLHLARNFYLAGARVIVCEIKGRFGLARFSTAVNKFYTLAAPENVRPLNYVNALAAIVEKENVSYYIPVSATNEAFYDALAKPQLELLGCTVFCPTFKEVLLLDDLFEVLSKCRSLGLTTPPYHHVTSHEDVIRLYESGLLRTNKHFMTNVGALGSGERVSIQVPPFQQDFRTPLEISHQKPWVIVQEVKGEHYVTCTTVKEGLVVGNVTCRMEQDDRKRGLIPVDQEDITHWIQTFFARLKFRGICGHFSFRFVVPPNISATVLLVGCKVGVSLPYICFSGVHPRIVWRPCRHFSRQSSGPLVVTRPRYWMCDVLLSALRHPSIETLAKLIGTVLDKREALFIYWDPLPYFAYYHFQLPLTNLISLLSGRNKKKLLFAKVSR